MVLKRKACSIASISLGLALVIFSLVWLLVIFPALAKLPADHHKIVNFAGTYRVMNPQTRGMDEIPVKVKREQQATEVQGNVIIIKQTITATHAIAGRELPQFRLSEVLGVDRSSREYVPGYGDNIDRSGQFAFPETVAKKSYPLWIPTAGRPLEAKFTGEEDFQGLSVYTFKVSEQDVDIGRQQGTGMPQVLDIVTELKVEPVSGTTVSSKSDTTVNIVMPVMKVPAFIASLKFSDDTTAELMDTARSARTGILWAKVYGFWLGIALGAVLTLVGILRAIQTRPKATT